MTMTLQSIETVRAQAGAYFGNGYHCAESVVRSVLDNLGEDGIQVAPLATAFGGGFGNTKAEACGAISGALIVVGYFFGRREPLPDWRRAAEMGCGIRNDFLQAQGTTCCRTLCDRFGEEDQMDQCRKLVKDVAGQLFDRLIKSGVGPSGVRN